MWIKYLQGWRLSTASVAKGDSLPTDASEISKKYLEMSDPPLSLGGSERNQHLKLQKI